MITEQMSATSPRIDNESITRAEEPDKVRRQQAALFILHPRAHAHIHLRGVLPHVAHHVVV